MSNTTDKILLRTLLAGLLIITPAVHSAPLQLEYHDVRFPVSVNFPSTPKVTPIPNPAMKGSNIYLFVAKDADSALTLTVSITTIPNVQGSISTEIENMMIRDVLDTLIENTDNALGVKGEVATFTSTIPSIFSSMYIEVRRETKPPQFGRYTSFFVDRSLVVVFASGVSSAQNRVAAQDFMDSIGVHPDPLNYVHTVELLNDAAKHGDVKSQNRLAWMYYKGIGVEQDYKRAAALLRKAADQGDVSAQKNLGDFYYQGQGVAQNYKQAMSWYSKAAEQGDANAQLKFGLMYQEGKGMPQNFVVAHKWLNLASAAGEEGAAAFRDWLTEKMTASQIQEAQDLAQMWATKHANDKQ